MQMQILPSMESYVELKQVEQIWDFMEKKAMSYLLSSKLKQQLAFSFFLLEIPLLLLEIKFIAHPPLFFFFKKM